MADKLKTEDMSGIVSDIYSRIIRHPEEMDVDIYLETDSITVSINPNPEDTGSVIGKEGKNIRALRNILASYALVNDDKRSIFIEVDSFNKEI
jgi:predicted RNA-binding protein YlqC (UPF0109 family)